MFEFQPYVNAFSMRKCKNRYLECTVYSFTVYYCFAEIYNRITSYHRTLVFYLSNTCSHQLDYPYWEDICLQTLFLLFKRSKR